MADLGVSLKRTHRTIAAFDNKQSLHAISEGKYALLDKFTASDGVWTAENGERGEKERNYTSAELYTCCSSKIPWPRARMQKKRVTQRKTNILTKSATTAAWIIWFHCRMLNHPTGAMEFQSGHKYKGFYNLNYTAIFLLSSTGQLPLGLSRSPCQGQASTQQQQDMRS